MCTYSMIIDHYSPQFTKWIIPGPYEYVPSLPIQDPDALKRLIDQFTAAQEAAKLVDTTLGTPDCEDPEKARLLDRIAELEEILASSKGSYVLKDGNWYVMDDGDAYTTEQKTARRFLSRDIAKSYANNMDPVPRVVKLV